MSFSLNFLPRIRIYVYIHICVYIALFTFYVPIFDIELF